MKCAQVLWSPVCNSNMTFSCVLCLQELALNKEEVYKVRKIADKRKRDDGEWEYLVEWAGYDDQTWEVADTLRDGAAETLDRFNEQWSQGQSSQPKKKRKKKK